VSDAASIVQLLEPFSRVFIQVADGSKHYAPIVDPTFGLLLVPGTGTLVVWRGGNVYVAEAADPAASSTPAPDKFVAGGKTIDLDPTPPTLDELREVVVLFGAGKLVR
jgi:hypothetical protein